MNPIERGLTWIDVLIKGMRQGGGVRDFKQGKHAGAFKHSPNAREERRIRNKRERQARRAHYRRLKS